MKRNPSRFLLGLATAVTALRLSSTIDLNAGTVPQDISKPKPKRAQPHKKRLRKLKQKSKRRNR